MLSAIDQWIRDADHPAAFESRSQHLPFFRFRYTVEVDTRVFVIGIFKERK